MDEKYLLSAVRYVELNPVRAKIVPKSQGYRWSSARAHLEGIDDDLVKVRPMLDRVDNWSELLAAGEQTEFDAMRKHECTGRPLGMKGFVEKVSSLVGRDLSKKRPGPKRVGS